MARGVGDDYSKEAIISNIPIKGGKGVGGNYWREVINIERRLLFEEIRYLQFCRNVLYRLDP